MRRRISWQQVPPAVRGAVEGSLGSRVLEAVSQEGGYSPGAACRVRLESGRRAFVKVLSTELHAPSAGMYRREAAVMPCLARGLPVPRLLDVHDDGNWIALVYEDVAGRHPSVPWRPDDLDRVAGAIADLGAALDPSPWPEAPAFDEANASFLQAWRELAAAPPPDLDPAALRVVAAGVDLAEVVRGDALLHNDIRSDNVLLTPDGRVVFVDWGMPCRGAAWQDLMMFALTVEFQGGADADALVRSHPLTRDIAASSIDVVVAAGYATYRKLAGRQVDPMLPTSSGHLAACAEATLGWLRRRASGRGAVQG